MSFRDHPSFNIEHYDDALDFINYHANRHGLEIEVQQTFNSILHQLFLSNDYPTRLADYMSAASDALYEWDI